MQLKYNRLRGIGTSLARVLIKLVLILFLIIAAIFLIEKINFPSPTNNYKIDITNQIKQHK